jgi:DNA helicase II / ATP-dependent DNA helicase PcrA
VRFTADLHIHSKYSRACSKDCDLEHLSWWARRKGITLVGTGDFTHPAWSEHLHENLVDAEPGLYRLRDEVETEVLRRLPPSLSARPVRFLLTVEISTIYKRGERTRKVHHVVHVPSLQVAEELTRRLARIGNLGADGRPILGLDSRDLLEIVLESGEDAFLVPAHIWTPWFAALGSKSGFDSIADCYVDLADHVFAVETGLSSDPEMNWRVSSLDSYQMVSNSDAHSPPMLGREATVFDTDLDYYSVLGALRTGKGLKETIEFFPEEGKYHADGHRTCDISWTPEQTRANGGICPACGKPVTVGVLNRIEQLADRPPGFRPEGVTGFRSLIPLPEIVSEIVGTGPRSKRVLTRVDEITAALGPEMEVLSRTPTDLIASCPTPIASRLAEAVARLRRGEVIRRAGFDGEYGVIRVFEPGELSRLATASAPALFEELPAAAPTRPHGSTAGTKEGCSKPTASVRNTGAVPPDTGPMVVPGTEEGVHGPLAGLDPDQRSAAGTPRGPLLIVAGPGTGKTRTLTHRIAHQVLACDVPPEQCLAITFTRRAAGELAERLTRLLGERAGRLTVATFHALGLRILREQHERAGLSPSFSIADPALQLDLAKSATGSTSLARRLLAARSRGPVPRPTLPTGTPLPAAQATAAQAPAAQAPAEQAPDGTTSNSPQENQELPDEAAVERYLKELRERDLVDLDDLLRLPVALLQDDPDLVTAYRQRYRWISVDEYQDIDEHQYALLCHLAPPDGNLTAIGDPDQAIYRFRGADVGFFLSFRQDFPSARTVHLTRNYRTAAPILDGALRVIAPGTLVPGRTLVPVADHPPVRVGLHTAADARSEASFVARSIEQVLGGASFHSLDSGRVATDGTDGLGFNDIAVLYRTDRQSAALMDALTTAGLPFQKRGHDRLLDRPAVRAILDELQYAATGQADQEVLQRVRRVTRTVRERLAAADPPGPSEPSERAEAAVHTAVDLLTPLARACGKDLDRFRTELSLGVEVDTWDPRAERISLLTLHAAKGLEFDVVYIVGCEDGLLPFALPGRPVVREETAEERRLLFVGMTRARRHLVLTHAAERSVRGSVRRTVPSPFLAALGPDSCERLGRAVPRSRPKQSQLRLI